MNSLTSRIFTLLSSILNPALAVRFNFLGALIGIGSTILGMAGSNKQAKEQKKEAERLRAEEEARKAEQARLDAEHQKFTADSQLRTLGYEGPAKAAQDAYTIYQRNGALAYEQQQRSELLAEEESQRSGFLTYEQQQQQTANAQQRERAAQLLNTSRIAAGQELAAGQWSQEDSRRKTSILLSRAQAVSAASGSEALSPTVMNLISGLTGEGEIEAQTIAYESKSRAGNITYEGALAAQGEQDDLAGRIKKEEYLRSARKQQWAYEASVRAQEWAYADTARADDWEYTDAASAAAFEYDTAARAAMWEYERKANISYAESRQRGSDSRIAALDSEAKVAKNKGTSSFISGGLTLLGQLNSAGAFSSGANVPFSSDIWKTA